MIVLYQFANSVCCQKVRLVLSEKQLEWNTVEVDLTRNAQHDPAYLMLNPTGVVPTLIHEGEVVIESTLICEYLEEAYPQRPLAPVSPGDRAVMRRWSKMVDEGLHEGISEITFSARRDRLQNMTPDQRDAFFNNVGDPRRRDRFRSTFEMGARSQFVLYAVAAFERAFRRLEEQLADGGPWIMGDRVTLADIALAPYVSRLSFLGLLDLWVADKPRVQSWMHHVERWPAYRREILVPMSPEIEAMARAGEAFRPELADVFEQVSGARLPSTG